jgi:hypothetical protein
MMLRKCVLACALCLGLGVLTRADDKADFTPLFNGKDLSGWKTLLKDPAGEPSKTWVIVDGVIQCTGKPNGYFYTEKSYKNYTFRYDWMYPKEQGEKSSMNSGLLVHVQGEPKIWPKCVEAQGAFKNHGMLYFLQCKKIEAKFEQAAVDKARKPQGEWNTTEVVCAADGTITVKLNGVEVASGKSDLLEGQIGFQSEGAIIHFKNLHIKEMK